MNGMKIAIIDDDPFVVANIKRVLEHRIPSAATTGIVEPVAPAGFDVYIVDKDFEGVSKGPDVVTRIRAIAPHSLVIAYSAHLDRNFLRTLLRQGCEGAFDKGSLDELDSMIGMIETHFTSGRTLANPVQGIRNTARAISGLLKEWNLRLAANGRAHTKTYSDAQQ